MSANEKLINYYLLCTTRNGKKSHIVNEIPEKKRVTLFTKKEMNLFLRKQDGLYVARDIVVGGESTQRHDRHPIVVIL